jgi:hypothetical protein
MSGGDVKDVASRGSRGGAGGGRGGSVLDTPSKEERARQEKRARKLRKQEQLRKYIATVVTEAIEMRRATSIPQTDATATKGMIRSETSSPTKLSRGVSSTLTIQNDIKKGDVGRNGGGAGSYMTSGTGTEDDRGRESKEMVTINMATQTALPPTGKSTAAEIVATYQKRHVRRFVEAGEQEWSLPVDARDVTIECGSGGGGGGDACLELASPGGGGASGRCATLRVGADFLRRLLGCPLKIVVGKGGDPGEAGGASGVGAVLVCMGGGAGSKPNRPKCGGNGGRPGDAAIVSTCPCAHLPRSFEVQGQGQEGQQGNHFNLTGGVGGSMSGCAGVGGHGGQVCIVSTFRTSTATATTSFTTPQSTSNLAPHILSPRVASNSSKILGSYASRSFDADTKRMEMSIDTRAVAAIDAHVVASIDASLASIDARVVAESNGGNGSGFGGGGGGGSVVVDDTLTPISVVAAGRGGKGADGFVDITYHLATPDSPPT